MGTLFEVERLFFQQLQQPGWGLNLSSNGFVLATPSREHAKRFCHVYLSELAEIAKNFGFEQTWVDYPKAHRPYRVLAAMSEYGCRQQGVKAMMGGSDESLTMSNQFDLLGADYVRIHEFLIEQRQSGNIVVVTSNITRDAFGNPISTSNPEAGRDICHHTSDSLLPSRAHWSARQFTGYNYRLSWRASFDDYEHLNPQYDRLKEVLARDGHALNYEYTLYRPDGALCSYSTTYFLCRDYCGDEVRVAVSRPQDWQLLELAPVT